MWVIWEGETLTGRVQAVGDRRWISCIVVGLDVRICKRLAQAGDDGLESQLWRGTGECIGQNVSCGDLDRLFVKVVFEDDETGVPRGDVGHNVLPVRQNLGG